MSITRNALVTVAEVTVTGDKLYGGISNPYYADPARRSVVVRVVANDRGQHLGSVSHPSTLRTIGTSPVLPDRGAADAWVAEVSEYARATLTDQIGERKPAHLFALSAPSACQVCGGFDTLSLSQEAWLDRVTCGECGDESVLSVGD